MTQATSRGMFSGCGIGLISSISDLESIMPVSTSTSPAGWSIVQTNHGPSLALDEELCREVRANHVPTLPLAACFAEPSPDSNGRPLTMTAGLFRLVRAGPDL